MGVVLAWSSGYPAARDVLGTNFPAVSDGEHDVLASHVNTLASTVVALQNVVGGLRVAPIHDPLSPSDGDVITWVAANSRFEAMPVPSGGGGDGDIGDKPVDLTGLADGSIVAYNASADSFIVATNGTIGGKTVDLTGISNGDVLVYDSSLDVFTSTDPSGLWSISDLPADSNPVPFSAELAVLDSGTETRRTAQSLFQGHLQDVANLSITTMESTDSMAFWDDSASDYARTDAEGILDAGVSAKTPEPIDPVNQNVVVEDAGSATLVPLSSVLAPNVTAHSADISLSEDMNGKFHVFDTSAAARTVTLPASLSAPPFQAMLAASSDSNSLSIVPALGVSVMVSGSGEVVNPNVVTIPDHAMALLVSSGTDEWFIDIGPSSFQINDLPTSDSITWTDRIPLYSVANTRDEACTVQEMANAIWARLNDFVTTTPAANDFIGFWDTSASGLAKAQPKPIVSTGINDLSLADPLDPAWVQASTMVIVGVGSSVRRVRSAHLVAPYIVNISTNTLVDYKTNNVLFNCTSALDISLPDGSDPVHHPSHPFRCEVVANAGGAKVEIVPLTGATIVCSESSPYILKNHSRAVITLLSAGVYHVDLIK